MLQNYIGQWSLVSCNNSYLHAYGVWARKDSLLCLYSYMYKDCNKQLVLWENYYYKDKI